MPPSISRQAQIKTVRDFWLAALALRGREAVNAQVRAFAKDEIARLNRLIGLGLMLTPRLRGGAM